MSLLHPTQDDDDWAASNAREGLMMRVRWVKQLRAALVPFATQTATPEDVVRAITVLGETKEWL